MLGNLLYKKQWGGCKEIFMWLVSVKGGGGLNHMDNSVRKNQTNQLFEL